MGIAVTPMTLQTSAVDALVKSPCRRYVRQLHDFAVDDIALRIVEARGCSETLLRRRHHCLYVPQITCPKERLSHAGEALVIFREPKWPIHSRV